MNRAIRIPQYSDMKPFTAPDGVEVVRINRATNLPADESCPSDSIPIAFLAGTVPQGTCSHMGEGPEQLGDQLFHPGDAKSSEPNAPAEASPPSSDSPPHRNAFQKLFGLGKDKDKQPQ
jgi:penicillin-binding protein 1B